MKEALLKNPIVRYFFEVREELRKVTWPSQRDVIVYSAFVIGACVILAAYFGALDYVLNLGLEALVKVTSK